MKKINIIYVIFATGLIFAVSSCNKVLDTQPYDKVSEDVIWSSKANAETFIFSTYPGVMGSYQSGPNSDGYTNNLLPADNTNNRYSPIYTEGIDRGYNAGFNNFGTVRRCNQIIEKVGASTGISADDKKVLIAEGKALRGLSYYSVAKAIGRICYIDRVLKPEDTLSLPSTKNPTESYSYVIKDLEAAIPDLPTTKIAGRLNKYVVAAFLSEACLQAAAYKNYPAAPGSLSSDPLIDKAITYANMVVNEGGYSLVSDYGSMFNEQNPTSAETIFAIYRNKLNTTCDGTPMQTMQCNFSNDQISQYGGSPLLSTSFRIFEAWVEHGPTYNLSEAYLVKDKADPTKALPWNRTSQYLAAITEGAATPDIPKAGGETTIKTGVVNGAATDNIWSLMNQGRDARWDASVISDSSNKYYGEILTTCIKGNATRWMRIEGKAWYVSLSNMYWRKGMYNNVSPRIYAGIPTDYHYVCMRLGRVYMNLAEAYLLKGDVANAVLNLNKTRVTHGKLPPSTASSIADAWKDYKIERRVELTLENDYYWSLLRWGRYGGDANSSINSGGTIPELTEVPKVMEISKDRKSYSIVQGPFGAANNNRNFDVNRRYLFPVPQGLIDNNSKFGPQNPGW